VGLTKRDMTLDCLRVTISKTKKRAEQVLEFQMTPELKAVIDERNAIKPLSPYLFKTRKGESYLKEDNRCDGFQTI